MEITDTNGTFTIYSLCLPCNTNTIAIGIKPIIIPARGVGPLYHIKGSQVNCERASTSYLIAFAISFAFAETIKSVRM